MHGTPGLVTAFRSFDENARDEARSICDDLLAVGINATVVDDTTPDVAQGVYEVRVPAADYARAEEIVARSPAADQELSDVNPVDPSHDLDQVTIFDAEGTIAELQATEIQRLLVSQGIDAFIIGDSTLPMLRFVVRVPRTRAEEAREIIRDAEASGPAAAEEAERLTETGAGSPVLEA